MPINDHDYDSPSLKFAYARNMPKNMLHISGICSIYATYMRRVFHQIPHIFLHILPPKVPHILRKFSAINQHS